MSETVTITKDLEHLADRIEKAALHLQTQRSEHARLQKERDHLAARARELEQKLQGQDPAALLGQLQELRREQREWQAERRDVALRIEALVKKLERIEG